MSKFHKNSFIVENLVNKVLLLTKIYPENMKLYDNPFLKMYKINSFCLYYFSSSLIEAFCVYFVYAASPYFLVFVRLFFPGNVLVKLYNAVLIEMEKL